MIRLIFKEDDATCVAGFGGPVVTTNRTFDLELSVVEEWLRGGSDYQYRQFVGMELIPTKEPTR
jgi:hypothetical protein